MGYDALGGVVKKLCRDAGIEGNFTNHSLRATMETRGLIKGIPDKLIMEKTGHSGDVRSLQQYQRPSIEYKVEMSKAFDQVGMMHTSLATTSTTNSECRSTPGYRSKHEKTMYENTSAKRVCFHTLFSSVWISR